MNIHECGACDSPQRVDRRNVRPRRYFFNRLNMCQRGRGGVWPGRAPRPIASARQPVAERIGRATNNVAEWRSAVAVLDAAHRLGAQAVELRMDSELVVRQLLGQYQVRNAALRPYHERAQQLRRAFRRCDVRHVPRAQNALADRLANAALDRKA